MWGWGVCCICWSFLTFSPPFLYCGDVLNLLKLYYKAKRCFVLVSFCQILQGLSVKCLCLKLCRLGMRLKPSVDLQPTQVAQATASKILYLLSWTFISLFSFNFLYMWFFWGLGGIFQVDMKLLLSHCIVYSI